MNILLTGGLGYIGSYLYNKLLENNIIVLDNFSNNLIKEDNNILIIEGDIRDKKVIDHIVSESDIIIHLAAQINVAKSIEYPIYDADNNINGTLNILEAARKYKIEHFIYISSAAVYGIPKYLPIDESHPTNPISPYGLSKLTGERYSILYHDLYELLVTCLRFFNVFGPGQMKNSYSGVITKFIENINNDNSPIIFGDGNQIRDFVYIGDVIEAILFVMGNNNAIGHIFNIGTGNMVMIKDLANIIIKISNKDLCPKFENPIKGDINESYANITKARNILGFEPKYSLEKGLEETIKHNKNKET